MVDYALKCIGRGSLHVSEAYDYVANAEASGAAGKGVLEFLRLGSWGQHSQNLERDLFNSLLHRSGLQLELQHVHLKLHVPDEEEPQMLKVAYIPPFLLMHALWDVGESVFNACLVGEDGTDGPEAMVECCP